ncbi:MAG: SCO family protein [Alphaproteobacteria bacterium]|nr:SCO family protein [Alphaproteobacteria bacterium]
MWESRKAEERVEALQQESMVTPANPVPRTPLTGKIGGPFTLTDQDGKLVSNTDFSGKYLLVYFGYTMCPDMCPTGLQSIARSLDMLKSEAGKVQPLFITVDPARDTSARLKYYDALFNPKIIGLTGTAEQIAAVAKEYQVYYKKGEGDQDYVVDHSALIYLMDPKGNLVTTFDEQAPPKTIADALRKAWGEPPLPESQK